MFNKNQTGLALGSLFGIMHLLWVIAVAIGSGQALFNWWHSIHFMDDMHVVATMSFGTAILGIVLALIIGYVIGWVFAWLWNTFAKK